MIEPIIIEHENWFAEDQVVIEISLGNRCNYACSYCPDNLHDGTHGWHSKADVLEFLNIARNHYTGQILVQYTGGEPTMFPGFDVILAEGRDMEFVQSVISNGARTLNFWKRYAPYFDKIHLTYHQEFADLEHFRKVVEIAHQGARVHVNFTMIPERFDEIHQAAQSLAALDNTTITLKPLRIDFGTELYPYTDDQLQLMKDFKQTGTLKESLDLRANMRIVNDDGTNTLKKPSRFLLDGDNRWQGWNCWIGLQELVVAPNGDIYRGICQVGGKLGNIRDKDYTFPTDPIRCTKEICSCPTDIMTRKEKP